MLSMDEILRQEKIVTLSRFTKADGWKLGNVVLDLAGDDKKKIVVSIKLFDQHLFYFAGEETVKDNEFWVHRKRGVVERHEHSSLFVGREYGDDEKEYYKHNAVAPEDFAIHGGGFPIRVENVGIIGSIVVSGLVSEQDHMLCYNSLKQLKTSI